MKIEVGDKVLFRAIKEHCKESMFLEGIVSKFAADASKVCINRECSCKECEEKYNRDKAPKPPRFKAAIWFWWVDTESCKLIEKSPQNNKDNKKLLDAIKRFHKTLDGSIDATIETLDEITEGYKK